jgi:hypothetical protein
MKMNLLKSSLYYSSEKILYSPVYLTHHQHNFLRDIKKNDNRKINQQGAKTIMTTFFQIFIDVIFS